MASYRADARPRLFSAFGCSALFLDQLTKLWVIVALDRGQIVVVIEDFFELTNVRNPGASFTTLVFEDATLRLLVLGGGTLLAVALVAVFYRRLEREARGEAAALGMIAGGLLGNLIDRIVHGGVVDFLRLSVTSGYFLPTFNLADCFVVTGVATLAVLLARGPAVEPSP